MLNYDHCRGIGCVIQNVESVPNLVHTRLQMLAQ